MEEREQAQGAPPQPPLPEKQLQRAEQREEEAPAERLLREWAASGRACLDVRTCLEFAEVRLAGSLNIERGALSARLFELSAAHEPLTVVCGSEDAAQGVRAWLEGYGYARVSTVVAGEALWHAAGRSGVKVEHGLPLPAPAPVLFRPSPTLAKWLPRIEALLGGAQSSSSALDVGSGAGRDCVFLASRGWRVTGVEMFSKGLERMHALAQSNGCEARVSGCVAEVRSDGSVVGDASFLARRYTLVLGVRFLVRGFLARMAELVEPGGFIVYETFAKESEGLGGIPRAARLLSSLDLEMAFPTAAFDWLASELRDSGEGRQLRAFVARRRGGLNTASTDDL